MVSSDKDSDGDETPTEDNVNNDDQDVTPKKNRKPPVEVVTPSPAKRLRGLNLVSEISKNSEAKFKKNLLTIRKSARKCIDKIFLTENFR